jgi:diadenosine tetraphosphatase ApaH/serine/threonine PP2A family protein phosphatase
MLRALLADVHANAEAFSACLDHAQRSGAESYAFLGDLVGYGADPGWVVDRVRAEVERGAVAVLGNHDQAVARQPSGSMDVDATRVIEWTRSHLDSAQLAFLETLPLTVVRDGFLFVHANAWEPGGWAYVTGAFDAARSLRATECWQTFCGHVHQPALYHLGQNGQVSAFQPTPGTGIRLGSRRRWLAIPGSVGQPRDGNPAACYALFNDRTALLTFFRVPYDSEGAARKIRAAGLPPALGARLERGD